MVLADMAGMKIGLSICYDLRFPGLYRGLARAGAKMLTIRAAFTFPSGKAHRQVLLRARAIKTAVLLSRQRNVALTQMAGVHMGML